MKQSPLRHLEGALRELAAQGRLRQRRPAAAGGAALNLCSNDYLGYGHSRRIEEIWRKTAGAAPAFGAGASRLVSGDTPEHRQLERALASWLGTEHALAFTSGYAANVGAISALAAPGDHVISDALNHASIVDGCRLSRAKVSIVPHLDLVALEAALKSSAGTRRWVVTESYFSMDADGPDLPRLRALCDAHDAALVLDEAHALGVFGPRGRGRAAAAGITPDVVVGVLGKAGAAQGGFVAGSTALCDWLWNRARSFVYSTGLSPALALAGATAVNLMANDDDGRDVLHSRVDTLRAALTALHLPVLGEGPIVPVLLGSEERALAWSRGLFDRGILVQAIRPPTVGVGTSRLRVTIRADLTDADIATAVRAFQDVAREELTRAPGT